MLPAALHADARVSVIRRAGAARFPPASTFFSFLIMKYVNKVILLGNATRDAELKSTKNGHAVCTFGLATSREWTDAGGERQVAPEFHDVVVWGPFGEACAKHVKKGKPLYVEGRLHTSAIERSDGTKNRRTEIVAEEVVFLGQAPQAA